MESEDVGIVGVKLQHTRQLALKAFLEALHLFCLGPFWVKLEVAHLDHLIGVETLVGGERYLSHGEEGIDILRHADDAVADSAGDDHLPDRVGAGLEELGDSTLAEQRHPLPRSQFAGGECATLYHAEGAESLTQWRGCIQLGAGGAEVGGEGEEGEARGRIDAVEIIGKGATQAIDLVCGQPGLPSLLVPRIGQLGLLEGDLRPEVAHPHILRHAGGTIADAGPDAQQHDKDDDPPGDGEGGEEGAELARPHRGEDLGK